MADLISSRNSHVSSTRTRSGVSKAALYRWLSWLIPALLVVIWEAAARIGVITPQVLPAPSSVLGTALDLARNGELFVHLGVSLLRAVAGFIIGGTIGIALGIMVGFSPLAQAIFDRSIQMVRAVPFLAMLPLVIVWFGVGEVAKIFLVALAVLFPIYINTMLGIRQIDPKLMELAKVIGLNWPAVVRRIILPGAMPSILTGVRYALAHAWLALVIAETLATTKGIGFLAMDAREFLQTNVIVLTIIIYAIIGVVADALVRALEGRFLSWHANYANGVHK
ncbi:ABC transporter permease subunit [Paraburkholderia hospita]|uniref:ABC transporter permease n=1 Tax=Paraburkholderia hospita TaxID=169430 RepID=A0AAN1JHD3_9BURK|nr:ABC transporter permease subunit [Paraburkholderia hospita]SKD00197.1 sulfonate transport system permease protein [Burkholderia sp. CF099]AUT73977.1 ABC transporter permease [Paraburkholderia hospita]AXF03623.1 ABC transporter permease [Paraburkholderia hospita]OUL78572.1 ABC transporter permease [Paraburkholderia hospita]OUL85964.1 ABC transporter permease [Paraburkholderia hospita]